MLEVPVYNTEGQQIDTLKVDENLFGGSVNSSLLKQAIVTYHANRRQGTMAQKTRGQVEGSTRKLYKQKGTGNARRGPVRTPVMKGGGRAFAKETRDFRKALPKNMRKAALNSAILAKMEAQDVLVVDGLKADEPKTSRVAKVLQALKINRTCLLAIAQRDRNLYLSSRNLPDLTVCTAADLNAFDISTRAKLLLTFDAMKALLAERLTKLTQASAAPAAGEASE